MSQDGPTSELQPRAKHALGSVFKIRSSTQLVVTELANDLLVHLCVTLASRALAKSEYIGHRSWTYGHDQALSQSTCRPLPLSPSLSLGERLDPDPRDELLMGPRPIPRGLMRDPTSSSRSSPSTAVNGPSLHWRESKPDQSATTPRGPCGSSVTR
jgi:hypothetical protein